MAQTHDGAMKAQANKIGISVKEYVDLVDSGKKHCYCCSEWMNKSEFSSDRSRFDGLSAICRSCKSSTSRKSYTPVPNHLRKPMGPTPRPPVSGDKLQARAKIASLVKRGVIPKPTDIPCGDCGHVWIQGGAGHEYHHHLGYGAEHHEDVIALCTMCHHQRDNEKKKQTHCIHGHEFTEENTIRPVEGGRACRECRKRYDRLRGRDAAYWRSYRAKRKNS